MPKNQGEPRKMNQSLASEFFMGGSNGKVVVPGILAICAVDKNRDSKTKNWLLAPNIQLFGLKLHLVIPYGQFEPHGSMFSTWKRCLIGRLAGGCGTQAVTRKTPIYFKKLCSGKDARFWMTSGVVILVRCCIIIGPRSDYTQRMSLSLSWKIDTLLLGHSV